MHSTSSFQKDEMIVWAERRQQSSVIIQPLGFAQHPEQLTFFSHPMPLKSLVLPNTRKS
jgi:hypothetical protein